MIGTMAQQANAFAASQPANNGTGLSSFLTQVREQAADHAEQEVKTEFENRRLTILQEAKIKFAVLGIFAGIGGTMVTLLAIHLLYPTVPAFNQAFVKTKYEGLIPVMQACNQPDSMVGTVANCKAQMNAWAIELQNNSKYVYRNEEITPNE